MPSPAALLISGNTNYITTGLSRHLSRALEACYFFEFVRGRIIASVRAFCAGKTTHVREQ